MLISGCAWRMLPGDLPPWQTVYHYFRLWRIEGIWQQLNDRLRRMVRVKAGRHPSPSAAILDSQTCKLASMVSHAVGYDAANVPERDGARLIFAMARQRFPRLLWIWVDGG